MTIALGIMATDGVVVAADRQITVENYWKGQRGKILGCYYGGTESTHGACLVTGGASRTSHLQWLGSELAQEFLQIKNSVTGHDEIQARLAEVVHGFHLKQIAPTPGLVEVEMLIAFQREEHYACLLSTNLGVTNEHWDYAAVGVGAPHAYSWLSKLWKLGANDVAATVAMAAFVTWSANRTVDGCGEFMDINYIRANSLVRIPSAMIRRLEAVFESYVSDHQPHALRGMFGSDEPRRNAAEWNRLKRAIAVETAKIRTSYPKTEAERERAIAGERPALKLPKHGRKSQTP